MKSQCELSTEQHSQEAYQSSDENLFSDGVNRQPDEFKSITAKAYNYNTMAGVKLLYINSIVGS